MHNFIYDIPTKVYFGQGQIENLPMELSKYGKKVLLVYGGGSIKKMGLYDTLMDLLKDFEVFEVAGIAPNPRIESVREGVKICKEEKIDVCLAVGGGSTIDATKFMAAGAFVEHDPWLFFSDKANTPIEKALPIVTVLTLSATGSEMDDGGVISNPVTNDKLDRCSNCLKPKASFLDPTYTYTVSKFQTACGSVDIMSHIMEVYFNMNQDFDMLDGFMESMLRTIMKYAPVAMKDPTNYEARANLMWASSWAINGFVVGGKKQSWSCHKLEHELSAYYDITHGLGLAILTPAWMRYCLSENTVSKYVQFGVNVMGIDPNLKPMDIANTAIDRLQDFFVHTLGLKPTLKDIGIDSSKFEIMARKAVKNDVIHGFIPLREEDALEIFKMCQ